MFNLECVKMDVKKIKLKNIKRAKACAQNRRWVIKK